MIKILYTTRFIVFAADSKYPKAAKPTVQQKFLLKKAWSYQVQMTFKRKTAVDVDRECIYLLEQRMFEWSERAGIAGCQQWGPDAGAYQMRWNPYVGKPSEWSGNYEPSQEIDDWDKVSRVPFMVIWYMYLLFH